MAEPTKLPIKTEKSTLAESRMPHHPLGTLRREIDRLFDGVVGGNFALPWRRMFDTEPNWLGWQTGIAAAVDVVEDSDKYQITAELPGFDDKNIEVKLSNGSLVIKGEKQEQKEEKDSNYYLSERRFGSFQRSFTLPEGVDAQKIDATFKNGVLNVTLPKTAEAKKEKTITVKAA
ncbi:MAG: Hsp20/alpha crystallin family protein [Hyphomicrobiales bacterium]